MPTMHHDHVTKYKEKQPSGASALKHLRIKWMQINLSAHKKRKMTEVMNYQTCFFPTTLQKN